MSGLTDVLKSPSVWTGKNGVAGVTDLLKNPPLQDKIQFGLMKSSFDTLVKTGEIVTPGTDLKAPTGLLYNAAANAGKSLISPTAGLTEVPKALGGLASGSLSSLTSGFANSLKGAGVDLGTGKIPGIDSAFASGGVSGAVNALSGTVSSLAGGAGNITGNLGSVSSLANKGTAQLGGLLANASKFGVGTAVDWAKGSTGSISGITGALSGGAAGATGALSGAASSLTSGLKSQMDSLAKQGQFAVNFSDTKLPAAVAGIVPAAGFKGTVDRATLNAATAKLVGSAKIALPNFSPQAVDTSALTNAASKAKGLLAGGLDATGALAGSFTAGLQGAGVDLTTGRIAAVDSAFASSGVTGARNALSSVTARLG
jgi:hypothetical protein